jgi:hypothetical protein
MDQAQGKHTTFSMWNNAPTHWSCPVNYLMHSPYIPDSCFVMKTIANDYSLGLLGDFLPETFELSKVYLIVALSATGFLFCRHVGETLPLYPSARYNQKSPSRPRP